MFKRCNILCYVKPALIIPNISNTKKVKFVERALQKDNFKNINNADNISLTTFEIFFLDCRCFLNPHFNF